MRTLLLMTLLLVCVPAYAAEPCSKATDACTRWVSLGGESRSLVYSTYPLDKKNEQIVASERLANAILEQSAEPIIGVSDQKSVE